MHWNFSFLCKHPNYKFMTYITANEKEICQLFCLTRDPTLQNVHAEFNLFFLFHGKHETMQTCLKKKKKKRKAVYLWDDWLITAVNGPVSKEMVTALPISHFKSGFWGCKEICINIGITECLLFKMIFLLPRNVLNVDNQAVSES